MRKLIAWIGYALIAIGIAFHTPLGEFLPVDPFITFSSQPYWKIVPSDQFVSPSYVFIGCVGVVLVVVAKLIGRKSVRSN